MNKIRSIIIDDEAANRDILESLLRKHCPSIEVIAMAGSASEGYELIRQTNPELVFLDIKMPVKTGFDLLGMFDHIPFKVIFVTSYDEYAIQAFEFNAVDYILKPIDYTKLIKSVERVEETIRQNTANTDFIQFIRSIDEKTKLLKSISLHRKDKVLIIDIDNISYIQAIRNYCEVVTYDNQRILSTKTLSDYEQLLEPYENFLRINKGYLINIHFIKSYSKGPVCFISMKNDDQEMEVSRRKKSEILHYLKSTVHSGQPVES
jgi:two-component system, LytTR family, response regulator